MNTIRIITLLIFIFSSNLNLGQEKELLESYEVENAMLENALLENALLEKFKQSDFFNENIYAFKGKALLEFELTLLNGKTLKSESLKGKPTLINFWFTSCAPCIDELPLLNKIKEKFEGDINFISITFQDASDVTEFLKDNTFEFSHVINSKAYLRSFGRFGYPKTLILDKNLVITDIIGKLITDIENEEKNKREFITRISTLLSELKKR